MAKLTLTLTTTVEPRGPAAAVILTDDQVESLGGGKTPPVRITVGGITIPARIGRMGGENLLGLSKANRVKLGVEPGDEIDVRIELDDQPREVDMPPALTEALAANAAAQKAFDALSFSVRKEHARAVSEAKQDATRERRIAKILADLA